MKNPTIIIEIRGGLIQKVCSTSKDLNLIVVDYDNLSEPEDATFGLMTFDTVKANHDMLVEAEYSECHDEIDEAVYNRLKEIGQEVEV